MFHNFSNDDGRTLPFEYLPAGEITPKHGMALHMTGGKLAVAGGANKASYMSMGEYKTAVKDGELIPVVKLQKDQVWEAQCDAPAACVIGTGYDVTADGLKIDSSATTTANFVVQAVDEAAGVVYGRFDA